MRLTEQDWNWVYADTAYRWTLQEFARVAGHPWYALQQQSDAGATGRYTGSAPPTTEDEFLARLFDEEIEFAR
jgi:hypothetical protein